MTTALSILLRVLGILMLWVGTEHLISGTDLIPFIGQVFIETFTVLLFIGSVMAAWHLVSSSTRLPPSAAEL